MALNEQAPINKFYGNADEAAENADLHININPAARQPAPAPLPPFQPTMPMQQIPQENAEAQKFIEGDRIGANEINNTADTETRTTTTTKQETHINWGGVAKGVAIVGAVVLVGVVGWWAIGGLTQAALAVPAVNTMATAASTVLTPVAQGLSYGGHWLAGFLPHTLGIASGFVGSLFGVGGATLAGGAAATTIGTASALGAGGAIALGTPIAANALSHVNFIDHGTTTQTVTPHTTPHDTQAHDGNFFTDIFASKAAVTNQAAMDVAHTAEHAQHTAIDLAHHSTHGAHEAGANELADMAGASEQKHSKWADRMAPRTNRPSMGGSYASQVLASKAATPAVTSRGSNFSEALDVDRAKLDAALGEPAR